MFSVVSFLIFLLFTPVGVSGEVEHQKPDGHTLLHEVVREDTALLTPRLDARIVEPVSSGPIKLECVFFPAFAPICKVSQ